MKKIIDQELESQYLNHFLKVKNERYGKINSFFDILIAEKSKNLIYLFFKKNKKIDSRQLTYYLTRIERDLPNIFFDILSYITKLYSKNSKIYCENFYSFLINFLNRNYIKNISQYKIFNSFFQNALKHDKTFMFKISELIPTKGIFESQLHTLIILKYIFKKQPDFFTLFINKFGIFVSPMDRIENFHFIFKSDIIKRHILKHNDKYLQHPYINFLRTQYHMENF